MAAAVSHKRRLSTPLALLTTDQDLITAQYTIDLQPLLDAAVRVRDSSHYHPDKAQAYQAWWFEKARKLLGHVTGRVYFTLSRSGLRTGGRRVPYIEQSGFIIQPSSYAFLKEVRSTSAAILCKAENLNIRDDDGERHEFFFRDYQVPPAIVYQVYDRRGSMKQESYGGWELVPPVLHTISEEQLRGLLTLNIGFASAAFGPFFPSLFCRPGGHTRDGNSSQPL